MQNQSSDEPVGASRTGPFCAVRGALSKLALSSEGQPLQIRNALRAGNHVRVGKGSYEGATLARTLSSNYIPSIGLGFGPDTLLLYLSEILSDAEGVYSPNGTSIAQKLFKLWQKKSGPELSSWTVDSIALNRIQSINHITYVAMQSSLLQHGAECSHAILSLQRHSSLSFLLSINQMRRHCSSKPTRRSLIVAGIGRNKIPRPDAATVEVCATLFQPKRDEKRDEKRLSKAQSF